MGIDGYWELHKKPSIEYITKLNEQILSWKYETQDRKHESTSEKRDNAQNKADFTKSVELGQSRISPTDH